MHCQRTKPISVILPAYNEEEAVRPLIEEIRRVLTTDGVPNEIILVDDGSIDKTAQEAILAGARVLQHSENRGYGAAIKTGILAAEYEIIAIIDADGTYPPGEIPFLVEKLETADMVVGARIGKKVHDPLLRRPAKWLLCRIATQIAGQSIPDLNSGLRVFRRESAKQYCPILSDKFSFTTTVTLALLADGYRIVYHPIDYYPRIGKSKIAPWHMMDFLTLILRMSMMFQPLKVFTPLGFTCGLLGFLKAVYDVIALFGRTSMRGIELLYEPVLSTSAVLLMLVGLQLLLIGMVADGVVRRIAQHNRPIVPSHAAFDYEASYSSALEEEAAPKER